MSGWLATVFMILLFLTALFLILLVLIQRGKGGGLAGAFGGLGGQSAFGTKAGDLFTRVTIGVAAFWIILCMVAVKFSGSGKGIVDETLGGADRPRETISAEKETDGSPEPAPVDSGNTP